MAKPNRTLALLAYLIPLLGPLFVLLTARKNVFASYHACQALALNLIAILVPLGWLACGLAVAWIPIAGPVLAAGMFALVIAAYGALLLAWSVGLVHVVRQQQEPVPIFGDWGDLLYLRLTRPAPPPPFVT